MSKVVIVEADVLFANTMYGLTEEILVLKDLSTNKFLGYGVLNDTACSAHLTDHCIMYNSSGEINNNELFDMIEGKELILLNGKLEMVIPSPLKHQKDNINTRNAKTRFKGTHKELLDYLTSLTDDDVKVSPNINTNPLAGLIG